jgi:hypothetical protein
VEDELENTCKQENNRKDQIWIKLDKLCKILEKLVQASFGYNHVVYYINQLWPVLESGMTDFDSLGPKSYFSFGNSIDLMANL